MTEAEALEFARETAIEQIHVHKALLADPMDGCSDFQKQYSDIQTRQRIIESGMLLASLLNERETSRQNTVAENMRRLETISSSE